MKSTNDYELRGPMLLRLVPWESASIPNVPDIDPEIDMTELSAWVARLVDYPIFMEALELSSPSAAQAVWDFRPEISPAADAKTLALTLSRYTLRLRGRATPFGLSAGVAVAQAGDRLRLRVGEHHEKVIRPDSGWLLGLIRDIEKAAADGNRMRVRLNPLCHKRGGRLLLPAPSSQDSGQVSGQARAASIRSTAVVERVVRTCREPCDVTVVDRDVRALFPQLTSPAVYGLVAELVARGFLQSDLRPPLLYDDGLEWLNERRLEPGFEFTGVATALDTYRARPLGEGGVELVAARAAMNARGGDESGELQCDLTVDANATIPRPVLREIEKAAWTLWRVSPGRDLFQELRDYSAEFVERYGLGRPVRLLEVLDPQGGLGAPPGYQHPPSSRAPGSQPASPNFVNVMTAAILEAQQRGEHEVELTEDLIDSLDEDNESPLWRSFDITTQVLAADAAAVERGDFTVVCSPTGLTRRAGQVMGRFASQLDLTMSLRDVFSADDVPNHPQQVQMEYRPLADRMTNVARVPRLLPNTLTCDDVHGDKDGQELTLADIAICADSEGLYPVSLRDGRELDPCALHMLNPARFAPNAVRLLSDLELLSTRSASPWQWRELISMPFLPRVRVGKAVLQPAIWNPAELVAHSETEVDWMTTVAKWRDRHSVPVSVVVSNQSQQLPLRLDRRWDLRLLRDELIRRPQSMILENLVTSDNTGWTEGRACEVTAMAFAKADSRRGARPRAHPHHTPKRYTLGSEWLYVKLYCDPQSWDFTIGEALPELINRLPGCVDRWFWLRYPDPRPHLRLRLHGPREELYSAALPVLSDWIDHARARNLLGDAELAEYEPETHRYGGQRTLIAAEELFGADSATVLTQLSDKLAAKLSVTPEVLAAANVLRLLHDFDAQRGPDWLSRHVGAQARKLIDRQSRRSAWDLLDPKAESPIPDVELFPRAVGQQWQERTARAAAYVDTLRQDPKAPDLGDVLASVIHMHINRLLGTDPAAERRVMSLARETIHAHTARRRS